MIVETQRAALLAQTSLAGPEDDRPGALFDLIEFLTNLDNNARRDCADAAQEKIYPLTKHYRQSLETRRQSA